MPDELAPGAGAGVRQERRAHYTGGRIRGAHRDLALLRDLAVLGAGAEAVHHDVRIASLFNLFLKNTGLGVDSHFRHGVGAPGPAKDLEVASGLRAVSQVVHHHLVQFLLRQIRIGELFPQLFSWNVGEVTQVRGHVDNSACIRQNGEEGIEDIL